MKGRQSGMPEEDLWNSFFDPVCILSKLSCDKQCGDVVEFGCGYGLFTEAAARIVSGCVYALDIEEVMIEATNDKMKQVGIANVITEQRDFVSDGCGRPDESVCYAMLFNILHIEEPVSLLLESKRVLKPGGKVGVIHWNYDDNTPRGPSMDIRPRPEQVRGWLEEAGFLDIRFDPLDCCPYHYGFVATHFLSHSIQSPLETRKRFRGEEQAEAAAGVGNLPHQIVDHLGNATDEGFLHEIRRRIAKDPSLNGL